MIKLKDLLKESHVWERKFGEKLPTLADVLQKYNEGGLVQKYNDGVIINQYNGGGLVSPLIKPKKYGIGRSSLCGISRTY